MWYYYPISNIAIPQSLDKVLWVEYYDYRDAAFAKSHLDGIVYHGNYLMCSFVSKVAEVETILTGTLITPRSI